VYILVIGCGKVGYQLMRSLLAEEHEVLTVDWDYARCHEINEEMGSVAMVGDGTEEGTLREAGANRADVIIAAMGNDEDNLVACQVAKYMFKVDRTIALLKDPQNQALFEQLGVDVTVSTSDIILKNIEEELPSNPLVHIMPLRTVNRIVLEIRVPPEAKVVGCELNGVELPPDTLISLVIRGNQVNPSVAETVIQGHDEIILITAPEQEQALLRTFTEEP